MPTRQRAPSRFKASRSSARRILCLGLVAFLWLGGLVARLIDLQVIQHPQLARRADRQQQRVFEITPKRGVIYDRNRRELAISIGVESAFAVPAEVPDRSRSARQLATLLHTDANELEDRLRSGRSFVWIKRKLDARSAQRLRQLNLPGIYLQREHKRFYPKRELAAHVLGFVGLDEDGLAGIEYSLDHILRGPSERYLITTDGRRHAFARRPLSPQASAGRLKASEGASVVLTLDENIQYVAERELAAAIARTGAQSGSLLVQDPGTGEIMALANYPPFNANHATMLPSSRHVNRAISLVFEPGSTFKVVTVGAALAERLTRPGEVIDCQNGGILLAGHLIRDHKPFGLLSVHEVISESSDVGAIKLGLRLGEEKMYEHIRRWRFGQPTGIELPAESRGLLRPVSSWSRISLGAISMGQEVALTSLQLTAAVSAIANDGIWHPPRIVREISGEPGTETVARLPSDRILASEVAKELRGMLSAVVREGTGQLAQPAGYSAAGKTGTAQKIDESGTYSRTDFIASFAGFAPVSRPRLTVTVMLDSPRGRTYHGGEVAAPVFRAVVEKALAYLAVPYDLPLDRPDRRLRAGDARVRDFEPGQLGATGSLWRAPGDSRPQRDGTVSPYRQASLRRGEAGGARQSGTRQGSPSASALDHGLEVSSVVLSAGGIVEVPNFVGQSLRAVVVDCSRLGLEPVTAGSGVVVAQQPAAGSQVPHGSRVWLTFRPAPPSAPVQPM